MKAETDTAWLEDLSCPTCGVRLRYTTGIVACAGCQTSWPILDGIPHFISQFPYWGEIPEEQMPEVLRASFISWRDALLSSGDVTVKRASEMILNLNRANWYLLTNLPRESRVLDLGAGMGANSHALALRYREVVAVEPVVERVQFMSKRFDQEGLRNVRIVRTSLWDLPFAAESFDLIVMNGVLEWVAQGRAGNPRSLQQSALRTARKLLRPGGVLYVGIENRFTAGYFVGYPDPHTGMPWVTILPRVLAGLYAKRRGESQGYRNYLYSARGYQKLLRESGFNFVECYLALPSYNHPRFYIPLEDNVVSYFVHHFSATTSGMRSAAREFMLRIGALKHLEYSFALLATK
jgi:SAM-dependent methyltransferase